MRKTRPVLERLLSKVYIDDNDCWIWQGTKNPAGYGKFSIGKGRLPPYRVLWILLRGPIPEGLVLDHLCRNPACCNPDHLEPVTHRENVLRGNSPAAKNARKRYCKWGHKFDESNTYVWRGHRSCRACARRRWHERQERLKQVQTQRKAS